MELTHISRCIDGEGFCRRRRECEKWLEEKEKEKNWMWKKT